MAFNIYMALHDNILIGLKDDAPTRTMPNCKPERLRVRSHGFARVSESAIKWVLFCLMAVTVPVLYFMFVVGGFLPLIAIVALSFTGVWGFKLLNAVHLVIYGLLFYWVAKVLSRRLSLLSQWWKIMGFAGISIALVAISLLPVYGIGHNVFQFVNLYRLYDTHLFPKSIPPRAIQP